MVLLHLPTIPLILSRPVLDQPAHVVRKPVDAPIPHPQPEQYNRAPEYEPERHLDPEHDGAVSHVQDLERDEEDGEKREDARDIGLCDGARQERGEVRLERARYAERGGEDGEEGRGD